MGDQFIEDNREPKEFSEEDLYDPLIAADLAYEQYENEESFNDYYSTD